ncbi:MAG TPA: prolyl oligopeptidase family serine peptidase [Anaeromyxobacter sp.]|nr:prolyl oligopeptidase family serine peptidase [Anaeromyxobacter sp.]
MNRLAAVALGLLLACGAELSAPGAPGSGTDPGTDPGSPGACEAAPSPGVTSGSVDVAGVRRTFVLVLPTADAGQALPVYFVFHGAGGSGAYYRSWMQFERRATRPGIFVYPDGLADGGTTGWPNTGGRDVAFFDALLAHVKARACVDERRVFATGFSYGGYMSNTLGCARAGVVRAVAPLSGGLPWATSCTRTPAAAWIAHGTADSTVAFPQGERARDYWVGVNGCGTGTAPVAPEPCTSYQGCAAGHPVVWCAFPGGHEVPLWVYGGVMGFFESLR